VAEGDLPVGPFDDKGLGVLDAAGAGRRVARVADGGEALKMLQVFLLEDLRDKAHAFVNLKGGEWWFGCVLAGFEDGGSYACTFLTSMLQSIEAEKGDPGDIFVGCVDPEDAAGFVQILQALSPRCASRDAHKF
jgi:hypothetical protein